MKLRTNIIGRLIPKRKFQNQLQKSWSGDVTALSSAEIDASACIASSQRNEQEMTSNYSRDGES